MISMLKPRAEGEPNTIGFLDARQRRPGHRPTPAEVNRDSSTSDDMQSQMPIARIRRSVESDTARSASNSGTVGMFAMFELDRMSSQIRLHLRLREPPGIVHNSRIRTASRDGDSSPAVCSLPCVLIGHRQFGYRAYALHSAGLEPATL